MTDPVRTGGLFLGCMLLLAVCLSGATGCVRKPPPPPPPEDRLLEQLNRTAKDAFDAGNYAAASSLYKRALERAHIRNDFTAITDARYNLSVSLLKQEDVAGAATHLRAAKNEFRQARIQMPPEFALVEANILYREGERSRAWTVTDGILTSADRADQEVLGRTHYLRGRIAFDSNDPNGLSEAIHAMGQPVDTRLIADLEELKGRLAFSEQRWDEAAAAFDKAARLQRRLLNYPAMADLLAMEARTYEHGHRPDLAAIRYFQAGRSAVFRGDIDRARSWLSQAVEMAERSDERQTASDASDLMESLEDPIEDIGF